MNVFACPFPEDVVGGSSSMWWHFPKVTTMSPESRRLFHDPNPFSQRDVRRDLCSHSSIQPLGSLPLCIQVQRLLPPKCHSRQRGQVEADGLYPCLCCHLCLRFDCDFDCDGLPQPLWWGSHVEADWPYLCLCRHLCLRFDHDRVAGLKSHSPNVEGYDAHYNHVDFFFATRSKRDSRRRGLHQKTLHHKTLERS